MFTVNVLAGLVAAITPSLAFDCPSLRVIYQPDGPLINATLAPDNKYGLEDGIVVRSKSGAFYMISAEMWNAPKWVAMRLGVWRSTDGHHWVRQRTLRNSSAIYNGTDQHAASWGPFLLWDPDVNRWAISYVGYRSGGAPFSGWSTNWDGKIFSAYAPVEGDAGLDSDFGDSGDWRTTDTVLLQPDPPVGPPWPPCQGLQGTDSMYPYKLPNGSWAAIVGTSHQEGSWHPSQPTEGKWPVTLATAPRMTGPWTRFNPKGPPSDAPCVNISNGHTENPIVYPLPTGGYMSLFDDLAIEYEGFGYTCSPDGLHWSYGQEVKVAGGVRTPFGLVGLTQPELRDHADLINSYGVTTVDQIRAANSTVSFLFYTQTIGGWETFRFALIEQGAAGRTL